MGKKQRGDDSESRVVVADPSSSMRHVIPMAIATTCLGPLYTRIHPQKRRSCVMPRRVQRNCNVNGKGVLRRLSMSKSRTTASPSPSPSDISEDSDVGSNTSMPRTAPPTDQHSFSLSSNASISLTTTMTTPTTAQHCLSPLSTYHPGSSYVPPSILPSVRPQAYARFVWVWVLALGAAATTLRGFF